MKKTPHPIALKDISNYLSEQNLNKKDDQGDIWVVTPNVLYNKETRKLNAELGVSKVNYFGNNNGKKK